MSVLFEHFSKNKASHHKQRQLNWCFLSLFYLLSKISAFLANIMSFVEAFARLRICVFRYVIKLTGLSESSKSCYFGTRYTSVVNNNLQTAMFPLRFHCVCLSHRERLIRVTCFEISNQKFEIQLAMHQLSDKARCFSQSERMLYGNFIIRYMCCIALHCMP